MKCEKGIILAGGTGSRLYPLTIAANKQLLPIYDKPVIYYPLTTLMLGGIREVLIISTEKDLPALKNLFGSGDHLGLKIEYKVQEEPRGLPEAFLLGEDFIDQKPVALILGDNFFHGHGLSEAVFDPAQNVEGSHVFLYSVDEPERYGVMALDEDGNPSGIEEKPKNPKSKLAITGLYYFDGSVSKRTKNLTPSLRGELEITDLIMSYMKEKKLTFSTLGRGYVWFDVGTPKSLLDASNYVQVIQSRQGISIASPEEVAWHMGYVDSEKFSRSVQEIPQSDYRKYLESLMAS